MGVKSIKQKWDFFASREQVHKSGFW